MRTCVFEQVLHVQLVERMLLSLIIVVHINAYRNVSNLENLIIVRKCTLLIIEKMVFARQLI